MGGPINLNRPGTKFEACGRHSNHLTIGDHRNRLPAFYLQPTGRKVVHRGMMNMGAAGQAEELPGDFPAADAPDQADVEVSIVHTRAGSQAHAAAARVRRISRQRGEERSIMGHIGSVDLQVGAPIADEGAKKSHGVRQAGAKPGFGPRGRVTDDLPDKSGAGEEQGMPMDGDAGVNTVDAQDIPGDDVFAIQGGECRVRRVDSEQAGDIIARARGEDREGGNALGMPQQTRHDFVHGAVTARCHHEVCGGCGREFGGVAGVLRELNFHLPTASSQPSGCGVDQRVAGPAGTGGRIDDD